MGNFLGPWLIAYTAMLIQCFSMFHFLLGCTWGQHPIKKWEANSFYVKKRQNGGQNSLKALHLPFPISMGLIFVRRGHVISGHLANRFGSRFGMNTKLVCRVICPISMPNDYLSTVIKCVSLRGSCKNNALPLSPREKLKTCCSSLPVCEKYFHYKKGICYL